MSFTSILFLCTKKYRKYFIIERNIPSFSNSFLFKILVQFIFLRIKEQRMEERFKYNPGKLESYANRNGRGGIACSTRSFDWLNFNQRFSLQYIVGIRKQRNRTENRTTRISFNIVPKWGMMFFLSPSIIEERGALFRGPLFPRVITLKFNLCIIQRKREIEERRPVSCASFERKKEEGGVDVRRPINMEPNYFFA